MRFDKLADWLSWQETFHPKKIDLGLARVSDVFALLRPDYRQQQPFTITVGGTNGKGSSVAMLERILTLAGYRVGTYTSPHILRYNERIRINGEPVDDGILCEVFHRIDSARGDVSLSFFEFGTLAALDLFADLPVDVQIMEVGLGGRLDAVNIVDADIALITSIDIDHSDLLGGTRELIGFEKAGIFRPDRVAVIGDPEPPASIEQHADSVGAVLQVSGRDFRFELAADSWTFDGCGGQIGALPAPALQGQQQYLNAAAVLAVLQAASKTLPVKQDVLAEGLATVSLAGRYQRIEVSGKAPVLLDVAHNPQAASRLADYLAQAYPQTRIHALFTIMHDKDVGQVLDCLRHLVAVWHPVPLDCARASTIDELKSFFAANGIGNVARELPSSAETYATVHQQVMPQDLVLVFGSFYLVSDYLDWHTAQK